MSHRIPLAERQARAAAMETYLRGLILSSNAPIIFYEPLFEKLSYLDKIHEKLKSFVRFLSKMNLVEYFRWMEQACSQYKGAVGTYLDHGLIESDSADSFALEAATQHLSPAAATVSISPRKQPRRSKKQKVVP